MIRCCIFDLDGTLLNTLDALTYTTNLTLKELDMVRWIRNTSNNLWEMDTGCR